MSKPKIILNLKPNITNNNDVSIVVVSKKLSEASLLDQIEHANNKVIKDTSHTYNDIDTNELKLSTTYATYEMCETIPDINTLKNKSLDSREAFLLKSGKWRYVPLYRNDVKGTPIFWCVGFDTNSNELLLHHGNIGGVMTVDRTEVKTNNSGRSIHEQSILEAKHRYEVKFRKGYRPYGAPPPEFQEPMRPNLWDPNKTRLIYPVAVMPKLDGHRVLSYQNISGDFLYRTRGAKPWFHLDKHFNEDLGMLAMYLPSGIFDGEGYAHKILTFTQIQSAMKTEKFEHPDLKKVTYCLYDYNTMNTLSFGERYNLLTDAYIKLINEKQVRLGLKHDEMPPVRVEIVDCKIAYTKEDIYAIHAYYVSMGYEGCVIKKLSNDNMTDKQKQETVYKPGRSNNTLKYKTFIDEEGEIISVKSGKGTHQDAAIFSVRDPRGNIFDLTMSASLEERKEWFQNPESVIGKLVTYVFQELSDYGIPRFASGKAIRDYD